MHSHDLAIISLCNLRSHFRVLYLNVHHLESLSKGNQKCGNSTWCNSFNSISFQPGNNTEHLTPYTKEVATRRTFSESSWMPYFRHSLTDNYLRITFERMIACPHEAITMDTKKRISRVESCYD